MEEIKTRLFAWSVLMVHPSRIAASEFDELWCHPPHKSRATICKSKEPQNRTTKVGDNGWPGGCQRGCGPLPLHRALIGLCDTRAPVGGRVKIGRFAVFKTDPCATKAHLSRCFESPCQTPRVSNEFGSFTNDDIAPPPCVDWPLRYEGSSRRKGQNRQVRGFQDRSMCNESSPVSLLRIALPDTSRE
jgi:hypothetical protein